MATPPSKCHVVAMAFPGRGHINPMMNLCKLIASKLHHTIIISFVLTEEWLGFIGSDSKPDNIRFVTIPNVVPSELGRGADHSGFIEATLTLMEEPFDRLLDRLEPPVSFIIGDSYLPWTVDVGNRRSVGVASLWPMSAAMFTVLFHFDLILQHQHFPVDLSERGDELVDYIPGLSPTRLADLPAFFSETGQQMLQKALKVISYVPKVHYLLFSSIHELEPQVIEALKQKFSFPIYTIGPLIPHIDLQNSTTHIEPHYIKWLDSQPKNSVLYISFGSFLSVSVEQMDEIIAGVHDSGVRYLWVLRDNSSRVKEACGDMGLVLPWCDQLRVLCHASIAGFWSHCGWNSTQEAVFAGVPVLTFPITWDQTIDGKLIVDEWKVGQRAKKGVLKLVKREEIASILKCFMNLESFEGKEMRRRGKELQEICQQAIEPNGSSDTNIDAFIRSILNNFR